MAFRLARPAHLVDINGVDELKRIEVEGNALMIGACVCHEAFRRPVVEGPLGALLAYVMRHIAHYPIRTRGTFCGSIAHADPASEWCAVAVALSASMVARSVRGTRVIPAEEFFAGIMTTSLAEDELLTAVRLPLLPADTRTGFYEFSRRAGDFAMAMAVTLYRLDGGKIAQPRIAIGGAEERPRRMASAEAALAGRVPAEEAFTAAADAAAEAVDPLEDIMTSAEYRRDLVRACTRRALDQSLA
jgi:carbon-monoxide dehydrogenase medium subunit